MPGGGSRLSRLSRDWSILETAEQNRNTILLMSCCSGQSQSIIHHHRHGDSRPDWAGALPLVGSDLFGEKVLKSRSAIMLHSSSPTMPCSVCGGGRGLGGAANSQLTVNVSSSFRAAFRVAWEVGNMWQVIMISYIPEVQ